MTGKLHGCARSVLAAGIIALVPSLALADLADYAGAYAGTYQSVDETTEHGTWCAIVESDGKISGAAHSDVYGASYPLGGTISEGGNLVISAGSIATGTTFIGTASGEDSIVGSWRNDRLPSRFRGTFEGARDDSMAVSDLCGQPGS